ncbi:MAG TPA: retroviral-like aspartic protease family protein [Blastocatellia bacterium]|nr:retroviral-like aspartic protease family protein [Blastocatellia bacterium]
MATSEKPEMTRETMGEVRTEALLVNATDESLVRRGQLAREQVRSYKADALVDTGAVRSIVPTHVVQQLGLAIVENQVAEYADGRQDVVGVTEAIEISINGRRTLDEALVLGDEVIIGQTVLEKLDLLLTAEIAGSFRIPRTRTSL